MSKRKPSRSSRQHTDPYIKAAAHPTRQTILKSLKENESLSTLELEKLTRENRYNLYHHLSKLMEANLIEAELDDGRAKRYALKSDAKALERFVYLEREDRSTNKVIQKLLSLGAATADSTLPDESEIESVSVIFQIRERWSTHEGPCNRSANPRIIPTPCLNASPVTAKWRRSIAPGRWLA